MNADGMPSLWVQTVCVYSVRGLLGSDASDWSARRAQHAAAQRERIRLAAGKDRMSHACPIIPLTVTIERTWNLRFYWAQLVCATSFPCTSIRLRARSSEPRLRLFSTYFPQLSSQLIRKICALLDIRQRLLDYKGNPPGVGWAPAGSFEQRRIVRSQPQ